MRAQLTQDKKTVNAAPEKAGGKDQKQGLIRSAMIAALPCMETEIQEPARRTAAKLKKLTGEGFCVPQVLLLFLSAYVCWEFKRVLNVSQKL